MRGLFNSSVDASAWSTWAPGFTYAIILRDISLGLQLAQAGMTWWATINPAGHLAIYMAPNPWHICHIYINPPLNRSTHFIQRVSEGYCLWTRCATFQGALMRLISWSCTLAPVGIPLKLHTDEVLQYGPYICRAWFASHVLLNC